MSPENGLYRVLLELLSLSRKISLVFSVGLESSLSKVGEVRAPVDPARRYGGKDCDGKNMAALLARSSVVLLAH
jgi:hypothetical protein